MAKILVAGGAGFIGSHLSRKLLADDHAVVCVDNYITGNKKNIEDLLSNGSFSLLEHDLITPLPQDQKLDGITHIFHLASPASPNKKSPRSYIQFPIETLLVNSQGTYHLLQLAKKSNARFLYASTSEIYGDPQLDTLPESYFGNVNPNGIRSVYDEAKRFGEAMTMAFYRRKQVDVRIVRIFNTFGEYMQKDDGRVVSNFINQALRGEALTVYGKGDQTRSFCYISDMVEGLLKFMFTDEAKGEVVNMGNPDERTILAIAQLIKELTTSSSEIVFEELPTDDPHRRKPDITKAKQLLNWEPKTSLEEGLKKTIEYFRTV